jgi:rare lipoprotein A
VIRHTPARFGAAAAACILCALAPTAAHAISDGGLTFGQSTAPQPATGAAGTLEVRTAVYLGKPLQIEGTMAHGQSDRGVLVERQEKDGSWSTIAQTTTTSGGAFEVTWRTDHIGRFPLRAVPSQTAGATAAAAVPATGTTPVTVYRPRTATWYGPGFYGKKTACGQTLKKGMIGVAHRTLPCGTQIALYYKGRTITAPVIDRGPFRDNTTWDLTEATAKAIGFNGAETVGALRLPKATKVAARG